MSHCIEFHGIANQFGLARFVVLKTGTTGNVLPGPCYQGLARHVIGSYTGLPSGLVFRLQAFGVSQASPRAPSVPAFSPSVDITVR